MNKGIEASREVRRFTAPKILLDQFYVSMCREVVRAATAKIIHHNDLATQADNKIDKMRSYKAGATCHYNPHV